MKIKCDWVCNTNKQKLANKVAEHHNDYDVINVIVLNEYSLLIVYKDKENKQ